MTKVLALNPIGQLRRGENEEIVFVPLIDIHIKDGMTVITTDQAEAYAAAKVREALEEAANKVADPVNIEATIENFGWVSHGNYVRAHLILRDAVEAIRALIPKEPPCDTC